MPRARAKAGKATHNGYGGANGGSDHSPVRYRDVDAELLRECVDAVVEAGDAIILGATTERGAFMVRIKSDSGDGCWYPPSAEGLAGVLSNAASIARGM